MTPQTRQGSGHDWDDARRAALFADIVSLKLSIDEAAALHGLRVDVIQEWLRQFRRSALVAFDERLKKTLIDQGANADALTAAEFTGHVEDVSIADLVQTIEIAGKDAVITVTHEGADSRMWCSAGAIIDAESGRLSGEAAVYRILSFERGRMVADLRPEQRTRTIYAATHRLLIEALRRKDESDRLEQKLGNVNRFYRLGERSTSSRVRVSTDELSILRLFDGPRRLREVLAQSHVGDLETLTALARLVDDGYLVETDTAPASARLSSTEPRSTRSGARPMPRTERLDSAERAEARCGSERSSRTDRIAPPDSAARADAAARQTQPPSVRGASRTHRDPPLDAPREDASRADIDVDIASSLASFVPMSVSRRPERSTPRWLFAAMAAAVLAPAAFWFGETMSNLHATRQAHAAAAEEQIEKAALEVATFPLSTRVEPDGSTIWLDRHPVAAGHLDLVLPRDGSTHELRVAAPGFIPVTLLFADVPPPREIHLEPLPTAPEPPSEPPAAALPSAASNPPALDPRGSRPAHGASPVKHHAASGDNGLDAPAAPGAQIIERMPREEPRVDIIEDTTPKVRVIE